MVNILSEDTGMSRRVLLTNAKSAVNKRDTEYLMKSLLSVKDKFFGAVSRAQPPYGQQQFNSYP